jgi:hypothetical protein
MLLAILLCIGSTIAAAPFQVRGEAGALDGQVYLQGGTLLVGATEQEDRPGVRLAAEQQAITMPDTLAGYRVISEHCDRDASRSLEPPVTPGEGQRVVAWTQADMDGRAPDEVVLLEAGPVPEGSLLPFAPLRLALYRGGERQGEQVLDVTAFPCELAAADVDEDGRPELVLSWSSAGGSGTTRGATVYGLSTE